MQRLSVMTLLALGLICNSALIAETPLIVPTQQNVAAQPAHEDDQDDEDVIVMEDEEEDYD